MPVIERPNILFCLFDSLGTADIESSESAIGLPALSQLRSKGAFFNRTYTPCPESSPARASLFTGLDPSVHGLWTNGVTLSAHESTFAQRLAQAGYSNYLAGRYQLSGVSRWTTEQTRINEFDQSDCAHGPLHRSRQNAYLVWLNKIAPDQYERIFPASANPDNTMATQQQLAAMESLPEQLSFNYWVGLRVGEWIESQPPDSPFMAVAGFTVGELMGTESSISTDGESISVHALKHADAAISRLLERLDNSDRANDTVIIVTSARGSIDAQNADSFLHEKVIRVPLLISGAQFKQQTVDASTSTIDIAPTVLDIANVPIGPRMQGESLLVVLDGTTPPRGWGISRIRQRLPSEARNWQTALCVDNMKLIVCHDEQQRETLKLFDLDADPTEQINLAGMESYATELEQLIDQMIDARCALEDRTEPRIAEF